MKCASTAFLWNYILICYFGLSKEDRSTSPDNIIHNLLFRFYPHVQVLLFCVIEWMMYLCVEIWGTVHKPLHAFEKWKWRPQHDSKVFALHYNTAFWPLAHQFNKRGIILNNTVSCLGWKSGAGFCGSMSCQHCQEFLLSFQTVISCSFV